MTKYVWQKKTWTTFFWDVEKLMPALSKAKISQGYILGQLNYFEMSDLGDILTEEAFTTSAIEGEHLDRNSIRSSVAKRLGLPNAGLVKVERGSDGLVEVLIDATLNYSVNLTAKKLWGWQASLFPTGFSGIHKIKVGDWR